MKCKYCNNELKEGQSFCSSCGNKVEADLNVVDKTTMGTDGMMNYDFDFSDQIVNNKKENNNVNVVNNEPVVLENKAETNNVNAEEKVETDNVNIVNNEPVVPENKVEANNVNTEEKVETVDINKEEIKTESTNIPPKKDYSVLDEEDLNRKSNTLPIYLVGVILVIIGGYFFYQNAIAYEPITNNNLNEEIKDQNKDDVKEESKDDSKDESKEESKDDAKDESKEESKEEVKEDTNKESSGSVTVPTTEISYLGLILKIPNTLSYQFMNDSLVIFPKDQSWSAAIGLGEGYFQTLKANKVEAKNLLEQQGMTVGNYKVTYYGGTEWLLYEVNLQGYASLVGYADAPGSKCFVIVVSTDNNSYEYSAFKSLAPIIQSAR